MTLRDHTTRGLTEGAVPLEGLTEGAVPLEGLTEDLILLNLLISYKGKATVIIFSSFAATHQSIHPGAVVLGVLAVDHKPLPTDQVVQEITIIGPPIRVCHLPTDMTLCGQRSCDCHTTQGACPLTLLYSHCPSYTSSFG